MDSPKENMQVGDNHSYHTTGQSEIENAQEFKQDWDAKNDKNTLYENNPSFHKKRKAEEVEEVYQKDKTLINMESTPNVEKSELMEKITTGPMNKQPKIQYGSVNNISTNEKNTNGIRNFDTNTQMQMQACVEKSVINSERESNKSVQGNNTNRETKTEEKKIERVDKNITELAQNDSCKEEKSKDNLHECLKVKNYVKETQTQSEVNNKKKESFKYFIDYSKYRNKNNVTFSTKYKDSSINLSSDKLTCYGDKGWSSVFVNNGADIGKWYYEIKIEEPVQNFNFLGYKDKVIKVNPYIRVGFACRYMRYDYPIGTDKYSYCVNSKNGRIFNNSISYDCMEPIKIGDIIGCYLNLRNKNTYNFDPRSDKKLYEYLQNGILCDPKDPPILKKNYGSSIFFSLNGQIKKNAFVDIYEGFYHPSVSLYMGASAKINLGPHFAYNHLNDYIPCVFMEPPIIL
ncbi:hypothetical protein, conserved [Plasmodium gonderi]|uniref:B30.2/SPRY domain-containing protein n=1 Tax=Plasmodium gonderi TaxID=77519 RepID=A0A1Y1JFW0_PLAGO|nr:hypothetical protein, conserved [Plasmodium gonderi]GAW79642.1 hypothetical protein, conserved [Plasmodium gonderi]